MISQTTNPRLGALLILNSIFLEGAYANLALSKALNGSPLDRRDKALVTELVYGTVKAQGTLDWLLAKGINRPLRKVTPIVHNILRMAVYQIFYLSKIPPSAACNEAVELAKKFGNEGMAKFVNGVLRGMIRNKEKLQFPSIEQNEPLHIALTYLHPEWLVQRWRYRFGTEDTIKLCQYDNKTPSLTMRVNTLLISREQLSEKLKAAGIEVHPSLWSKDGLICDKLPSLQELMTQFGQYIYIQDESSMLVADVLNPQEEEKVFDLCSAPGGKTTHLAQKMGNKGKITATDIYEHKLQLVQENAKRLHINIIHTELQDGSQIRAEWQGKADKVLVDAPCSGLGVLGRRAEARWTKKEKDLSKFPFLQKKILAAGASYVKVGGRLLYSTCTLERDENTRVAADFLQKHPDFKAVEFSHPLTGEKITELQLLPQKDNIDGFYLALFERIK